jgi:hypothetical protein
MKKYFGTISFVALALATTGVALRAQDYPPASKGAAPPKAAPPSKATATPETATASKYNGPIKRMPNGAPDMRGTWNKNGGNLNEANPKPKSALEDVCLDFFREKAEPVGFGLVGRPPRPKEVYAPPSGRPQGIVDPPDRILPFTPAAEKLRQDYAVNMCCPAKSWDYVEMSARCVAPSPTQGGAVEIFQDSNSVTLLFEGNHGSRVIYTDGRPRLNENVSFFNGDSIGRWEGDTLVVETRNLNGLIHFGVARVFAPFTRELRFTERFKVVSRQLIDYELIYEDPKTFTKPVRVAGFFYPANDDYEIMETVCTEGNYQLRNMYGF